MRRCRRPTSEAKLVHEFFERRATGFFVEVGANEPRDGSQTLHLEEAGWAGILVEPLPELCDRLRRERPRSRVFQAACGSPEARHEATLHVGVDSQHSTLRPGELNPMEYGDALTVAVRTLDDLLEECDNPRIDFLSIDVEGAELDVLRGFDLERHRPALLLLEDHVINLASHRYLTGHGYRLVRRTTVNNWYVPRDSPAPGPNLRERLALVRKLYVGLPFRKLRTRRRRWKRRKERGATKVEVRLWTPRSCSSR